MEVKKVITYQFHNFLYKKEDQKRSFKIIKKAIEVGLK